MKKILIVTLCIFFITSCKNKAQEIVKEDIKGGQVKINVPLDKKSVISKDSLEYFNDVNNLGIGLLKPNSKTITIFNDEFLKLGNKISINESTGIMPLFFKPDYGIYYLVCIDENKKNFKVQSSNKVFYVKKDEFEFINWKDFLTKAVGIDNLNWDNNLLRIKPKEKAKTLKWKEQEDIIVIDLKDNWIKIQNKNSNQGWIKWRKNNRLLIDVYLLM